MSLSPYWLRDNCPCVECRDPRNGQKLFQVGDLPDGLAVAESVEDGDALAVLWSDGHRSRYPLAWLAGTDEGDGRTEDGKQLWTAADFGPGLPEADWSAYLGDERERAAVLAAVRRSGFALLRGVPAVERQVLEVARSFGYVRETNYGELFDVRVEPDPTNLAFTGAAIAPHTDNRTATRSPPCSCCTACAATPPAATPAWWTGSPPRPCCARSPRRTSPSSPAPRCRSSSATAAPNCAPTVR